MSLTLTNPVHDIQPQDEVMEDFRKQFRLVAGCRVSKDGKSMAYDFKSMSSARSSLSDANDIIVSSKLSLKASVRTIMKGTQVVTIQLIIAYKPKQ